MDPGTSLEPEIRGLNTCLFPFRLQNISKVGIIQGFPSLLGHSPWNAIRMKTPVFVKNAEQCFPKCNVWGSSPQKRSAGEQLHSQSSSVECRSCVTPGAPQRSGCPVVCSHSALESQHFLSAACHQCSNTHGPSWMLTLCSRAHPSLEDGRIGWMLRLWLSAGGSHTEVGGGTLQQDEQVIYYCHWDNRMKGVLLIIN